MARQLVTIGNADFSSVKGLGRTMALIAAIPDEVLRNLQKVEHETAEGIVEDYRAVVPVDDLSGHPGALRDSAHVEAGPHELAVKVVVDARDEKGEFFAKHEEFGHLAKDGTHVPARPALFPVVRLAKKKFRRDSAKAVRDGMKQAASRVAGMGD